MTCVAIIPARYGSRRVPRKNLRLFRGKPIMAYSIATAKESGLFDRVIVSTENEEIAEVAQRYGADVIMRPRELADDPNVGTQEVTAHALRSVPCDHACCIYATAPMMTPKDLLTGFEFLRGGSYSYVMVHGWYYWGRAEDFVSGRSLDGALAVGLGLERYIDIDSEADWFRAERMYEDMHPELACA